VRYEGIPGDRHREAGRPPAIGAPGDCSQRSPGDKVRFPEAALLAGVDLSMTTDLSAVSLVFLADDGDLEMLVSFWMPEQAVRQRERREGRAAPAVGRSGIHRAFPGRCDRLVSRLLWTKLVQR
jgi:hypothetical protein